jgi:hypothetical protein
MPAALSEDDKRRLVEGFKITGGKLEDNVRVCFNRNNAILPLLESMSKRMRLSLKDTARKSPSTLIL